MAVHNVGCLLVCDGATEQTDSGEHLSSETVVGIISESGMEGGAILLLLTLSSRLPWDLL